MSHTIKVSGVPDELLTKVDERWRSQHYSDRSEYVRDLIRRDLSAPGNTPDYAGSLAKIRQSPNLFKTREEIDAYISDLRNEW